MGRLVTYNGGTDYYYHCTSPDNLIAGQTYEIIAEVQSDWHTEVKLAGISGQFNSVWFNPAIELTGLPMLLKQYIMQNVDSLEDVSYQLEKAQAIIGAYLK